MKGLTLRLITCQFFIGSWLAIGLSVVTAQTDEQPPKEGKAPIRKTIEQLEESECDLLLQEALRVLSKMHGKRAKKQAEYIADLVSETPNSKTAPMALLSLLRRDLDDTGRVTGLLIKYHLNDRILRSIIYQNIVSPSVNSKTVLVKIATSKLSDELSAVAQFGAVASKTNSFTGTAKQETEIVTQLEKFKTEGKQIRFAGGTLANFSEKLIFKFTRLRIGKTVPEIIGEDVAGIQFKLSDYRGKIVLLDFWGDW